MTPTMIDNDPPPPAVTAAPPPPVIDDTDDRGKAAPPPPAGESGDSAETALPAALIRSLRELRAEIRDLLDFVAKVKLGLTSIAAGADYVRRTREDMEQLIAAIAGLNDDLHHDGVRHIINLWEQLLVNPVIVDPEREAQQEEQLHALTLLEDRAGEMIYAIGQLTIPERLNDWLRRARVGYYVPFHQLFEDELPDPESRQRVLRAIALAPESLYAGIVSNHNGLIYRYNPSRFHRWRELISFLLLVAFVTLVVWSVGHPPDALGSFQIPLDEQIRPRLLPAWIALLLGVVVHVAVDSVKRGRESALPPVVATRDWMLLFSARKGELIIKLLIALVGLFAMAFLFGPQQFTVASAFFVGYSLDSFIGLFGETMDRRAAAQLAALRGGPGNRPAA